MRSVLFLLLVSLLASGATCRPEPTPDPASTAAPTEFSVLVYNVENLFDVDGVALFGDYRQKDTENPQPYGPRKLLTKLENIATVLRQFNGGRGPDIVLFNELEFDRTPAERPLDYDRSLETYADTTAAAMLTEDFNDEIADLPVEALLLKHLEDEGLGGYAVVVQAPRRIDETVEAHTNAVFTRFPVREVKSHPTLDARDILEVTVEVAGHPLVLFCNHWKSGASNPDTEPTRVQNATVLRERVAWHLARDPLADIVIGGDLNSNYNQMHMPEVERTGVNDVLKSQGDELAIRQPGEDLLYNLWFELPLELRFSEIYRGGHSTLMHILLSRGLYHRSGVTYVDGSFGRVVLPGQNAGTVFNRPIRWTFAGDGQGFSDHLPVFATFRVDPQQDGYLELAAPSREVDPPAGTLYIDYDRLLPDYPESAGVLVGMAPGARAARYREVFHVDDRLVSTQPLEVEVDGERFGLWSPDREVFLALREREPGSRVRFFGEFGEHRGHQQFVILDADWLRD